LGELYDSLRVGDVINIEVNHPTKDRPSYRSRIEDKYEPKQEEEISGRRERLKLNQLLVPVPTTIGAISTILEGRSYQLVVLKGTAKLIFKAKIAEKVKSGTSLYFIFETIDDGLRVQSRNFFRADVMMPVEFSVFKSTPNVEKLEEANEKPEELEADTVVLKGTSRDISGGGMQFTAVENIEDGKYITISVPLEKEKLVLTAQIIRCEKLEQLKYLYRTKFVWLTNQQQDKIIRFVLDIQRKATARISNMNPSNQ
jgi:c-di-GMP-binding flagellar brake protein YcgR